MGMARCPVSHIHGSVVIDGGRSRRAMRGDGVGCSGLLREGVGASSTSARSVKAHRAPPFITPRDDDEGLARLSAGNRLHGLSTRFGSRACWHRSRYVWGISDQCRRRSDGGAPADRCGPVSASYRWSISGSYRIPSPTSGMPPGLARRLERLCLTNPVRTRVAGLVRAVLKTLG